MASYSPQTKLPDWYLQYAGSMANHYPDLTILERQSEVYKRLAWVGTAVDIVSIIGAMAGKNVKKIVGEKKEGVVNHPIEMRLMNPNPLQSGRSFIRSCLANYKIHNNAYIWMNIVSGEPIEFWNIPSDRIAPITDGRLGVGAYRYYTGLNYMEIPAEEIMHFKGFDPLNIIQSGSTFSSFENISKGDMQMQKWNLNTYKGNGRLPGVMTFADMIQDEEWRQIGETIDSAASTQNILRLRGTGSGAVNWLQTSSPPKDMEFYIGRNHNRDEIWSRIAPGLVSMLSENATEANARSGKATLIDLEVYPLLLMFYETFTQQVVWRYYGNDLVIEPDDIRVTDRVLQLSEITTYSLSHTIGEVRVEFYDDQPLGDERDNMFPAEANSYKTVKEVAPAPPANAPVNQFGASAAPQLPASESNAQTDVNAQQAQVAQKAQVKDPRPVMLELEKWERLAKKKKESAIDFICYNTPHEMEKAIKAELQTCASNAAIKALFDGVREKFLDGVPNVIDAIAIKTISDPAILKLAEAINADTAMMSTWLKFQNAAKADTTAPAPVYNFTMPPISLTTNMPEQGTPVVNFSPVIQPADNINSITIEPTPIQNNLSVNTPELESSEDVIVRDKQGALKSKTTKYNYADKKKE